MSKRKAKAVAVPESPATTHTYELTPIDDLHDYDNNARTHSELQILQLRASIKAFGFTNPVLKDEANNLIAGHGRRIAARLEGYTHLPSIVVRGLSDAQRRALVIADNKLALNAGWDEALLRDEIERLTNEGFDIKLLGFDDAEMARLLAAGEVSAEQEWSDMPEYSQANQMAYRSIIVHFEDDRSANEFAKLLGQSITPKTKDLWHPEKKPIVLRDKRYKSDQQ